MLGKKISAVKRWKPVVKQWELPYLRAEKLVQESH